MLSIPTMAANDSRQYMLNDNYEIYEKTGLPTGAGEMHFHNFYELLYISKGSFSILVDGITYRLNEGDILLIDINHLHHYLFDNSDNKSKRILLWITRSYLEQISDHNTDLTACFRLHETPAWHFPVHKQENLSGYLSKLLRLYADNTVKTPELQLCAKSWLALFFITLNQLCTKSEFRLTKTDTFAHPMIQDVSLYIDTHISSQISVDELAREACMSKYYFLHSFKALTGMTVHEFIIQKRLILACEYIWSGKSPRNTAELCGFSDYSAFFRNFKRVYGISPRNYKLLFDSSDL